MGCLRRRNEGVEHSERAGTVELYIFGMLDAVLTAESVFSRAIGEQIGLQYPRKRTPCVAVSGNFDKTPFCAAIFGERGIHTAFFFPRQSRVVLHGTWQGRTDRVESNVHSTCMR